MATKKISIKSTQKKTSKAAGKTAKPSPKKVKSPKKVTKKSQPKEKTKIVEELDEPEEVDIDIKIKGKSKVLETEKMEPEGDSTEPVIEDEGKDDLSTTSTSSGQASFSQAAQEEEKPEGKDENGLWGESSAVKKITESLNSEKTEEVSQDDTAPPPTKKSFKLYKRIVYFFIACVLLVLFFVFYFTFVRVNIVLIPNLERTSNNLIFDVKDVSTEEEVIGSTVLGIVREIKVEDSKEFSSTGEEIIGKEAVGSVTIYNNYTKVQPLVATTRLLSNDGKLFRIKNTVNVPVGGSVDVEIYADEASREMAIGPSKFTIPGLWAGLQDKVFAESKTDVVYRQKVKKYIVEDDIENAKRMLKKNILLAAQKKIGEEYDDYDKVIYDIANSSAEIDVDSEIGDEKDEFQATMEASVVVVAFNSEKTADLAEKKIRSSLSEAKELVSFDDENIEYSLNNYDLSSQHATINSTFEGRVSLKGDAEIISKDRLVGLKKNQLEAYLKDVPGLSGHEVSFYPSFMPSFLQKVWLSDSIEIEIRK